MPWRDKIDFFALECLRIENVRNEQEDTKDKKLLTSKYTSLYFSFNLCNIEVKEATVNVYQDVMNFIIIYREVVRHEQQK